MENTTLVRQNTTSGWQFIARPQADGTAWSLKDVHPLQAEVTACGVVYELKGGGQLTDCFDGTVIVNSGGQVTTLKIDGTAQCHSNNGRLRSELTSDGKDIEYWLDGPRQRFASWASVIVYDGH
jgi:hypothetical protein